MQPHAPSLALVDLPVLECLPSADVQMATIVKPWQPSVTVNGKLMVLPSNFTFEILGPDHDLPVRRREVCTGCSQEHHFQGVATQRKLWTCLLEHDLVPDEVYSEERFFTFPVPRKCVRLMETVVLSQNDKPPDDTGKPGGDNEDN